MEQVIRANILEFGKNRKKGQYKDSTIAMYVSNVKNLQKLVKEDEPFEDLEWARDVPHVQKQLARLGNPQTRRNYINSLIVSLQTMTYPSDLIRKYEVLRDLLNDEYQKAGYLTPNQLIIMTAVSKEDISDFLKKELTENLDDILKNQKRLTTFTILSIHTEYPFRNELGDMKIIRRGLYDKLKGEDIWANNWFVLENGWHRASFVMTKYKTAGTYGIQQFSVDPKYLRYIHKLFQLRGIGLGDVHMKHLFMIGDEPLTRNKVSKYLGEYTKKHLGHQISTTLMAKYFGCNPKDRLNPTPAELDRIKKECDIRGHSAMTKFTHYSGSSSHFCQKKAYSGVKA
jgi:hypothetical protein